MFPVQKGSHATVNCFLQGEFSYPLLELAFSCLGARWISVVASGKLDLMAWDEILTGKPIKKQ